MPKHNTKAFTIIEVTLVLAISGAIFSLVFIGLPALQRSQRDTMRRNDLNRFAAAMINYQAHNDRRIAFKLSTGAASEHLYDTNFVTRYIDPACTFSEELDDTNASHGAFSYVGCTDGFRDPDGETYIIAHLDAVSDATTDLSEKMLRHVIYVAPKSRCISTGDEFELKEEGNPVDFSMYYLLESGTPICIDNTMAQE